MEGFWRLKRSEQPLGKVPILPEEEEDEEFLSSSDKEIVSPSQQPSESLIIFPIVATEQSTSINSSVMPYALPRSFPRELSPVDCALSRDFDLFLKRNKII